MFGEKYDRVQYYFKEAVRHAGIDSYGNNVVTLHTLRHTHATRLEENGYSKIISAALGHADKQTTTGYIHAGELKKKLREAQESLAVAYSVAGKVLYGVFHFREEKMNFFV